MDLIIVSSLTKKLYLNTVLTVLPNYAFPRYIVDIVGMDFMELEMYRNDEI